MGMKQWILAALLASVATTAMAGEKTVNLFKVVSAKDEVTIGLDVDLSQAARLLLQDGHLRAWQYATARGEKGDLVQKPQREVEIFSAQVIRIEPVDAGQTVVPPPAR